MSLPASGRGDGVRCGSVTGWTQAGTAAWCPRTTTAVTRPKGAPMNNPDNIPAGGGPTRRTVVASAGLVGVGAIGLTACGGAGDAATDAANSAGSAATDAVKDAISK